MTIRFTPVELVFNGVTYEAGKTQELPQQLVDYIEADPVLRAMKPSKSISKYSHLRNQNLAYLKTELVNFENDLALRDKQIQTHIAMGSVPPKQLLVAQKVALEDYQELKAYVEPLIKSKEAQEAVRRKNIEAVAKQRGAVVTFNADGTWSESYERQTFVIGANK